MVKALAERYFQRSPEREFRDSSLANSKSTDTECLCHTEVTPAFLPVRSRAGLRIVAITFDNSQRLAPSSIRSFARGSI